MTRLAVLFAITPLALAFSNTVPFVAWSSHSSNLIDRLPVPSTLDTHTLDSKQLFERILELDVCAHQALVLVHQPGLHASDLRHLPKTSHIARSLSSAPSSRQFAYVPISSITPSTYTYTSSSSTNSSLIEFAQAASTKCNARLITITPGPGPDGGVSFDGGGQASFDGEEKAIVIVTMPSLVVEDKSQGEQRKSLMLEHDNLLSTTLDTLPFSNHVLLYTGSESAQSPTHGHGHTHKRQTPERPVLDFLAPNSSAPTTRKGGILHSYQLLTPGLITTLLVVLFVFLPVLYGGIRALASVQSPIRLEVVPKGYEAGERKNQ